MTHAPMKTSIELKGTESSLSVKFGILDEGVAEALQENTGDGVEFKIIALTDGREEVIFSRKLQPMINAPDRGAQEVQLDLSQVKADQLILETLPGENNMWDWSYWSEIKAE
ncbi:MAG: NPCBM/NEW2 domain-containing protein [Waterburya sp.]